MFAVFAAEQQYRHDTRTRDRQHAILVSIRERQTTHAPQRRNPVRAEVRPQRGAWARPIGLHPAESAGVACATA
ncbi:hypothetical protein [Microbacterium sp. E-13]|uniref:hypothetical protein n=1 Tax=Microbacterium sp. E-13 TaxID=3404048 RepID=UPI003CE87028